MLKLMPKVEIEKIGSGRKHVLIVDNKSAHLHALQKIVREKIANVTYRLEVTREVTQEHVEWADLVILSGGSGLSIEKNPLTFRRLVSMVIEAEKPLIGICLGAEAIGVFYGAELSYIGVRRVGNIAIYLKDHFARQVSLPERIIVYEFHRWRFESIPPPLVCLASSKDGVEIFRHKKEQIWGMQFHPEARRKNNGGHSIFESIVQQILR